MSDDELSTIGVPENTDDDSEEDSEFEFDVMLNTPKRKHIINLPANQRPQVQQQVKKMASGSSMSSKGSTFYLLMPMLRRCGQAIPGPRYQSPMTRRECDTSDLSPKCRPRKHNLPRLLNGANFQHRFSFLAVDKP